MDLKSRILTWPAQPKLRADLAIHHRDNRIHIFPLTVFLVESSLGHYENRSRWLSRFMAALQTMTKLAWRLRQTEACRSRSSTWQISVRFRYGSGMAWKGAGKFDHQAVTQASYPMRSLTPAMILLALHYPSENCTRLRR